MANMKAILFAALPVLVFGLAIFLVQLDKSPQIVHTEATARPGYETTPSAYRVEASPSKKWHDYAQGHFILIILGFLVAGGATFGYLFYLQKAEKVGNNGPIFLFWILGAALIFGPFAAFSNKTEYQTTLNALQYDTVKDDPDILFPTSK